MSDTPVTDAFREVVFAQYKEDELTGNGMGNILAALPDIELLERERDEARELLASEKTTRNHIIKRSVEVERERDDAREDAERWESSSDAMERAGAEQARRADENREWALKAERERDEAREKAERYRLEANAIMLQRDEALMDRANGDIATMTINHYERILRERDEWKNKAYSHATDYTLMEAKCFRLEQQLKEYDQLKS